MSMSGQPRPEASVAAETQFLTGLGVPADYAGELAAMPATLLAEEVVAPWHNNTPGDVLAGLMEYGPELPVIDNDEVAHTRTDPADYPEHAAMVHRLAGSLGLQAAPSSVEGQKRANAAAMGAVFGVAPEAAYEATALANPGWLAEQVGAAVADEVTTRTPHDSMDPAMAEDAFAGMQDTDWANRPAADRLAATGFHLRELARLGFQVTLAPRENNNG